MPIPESSLFFRITRGSKRLVLPADPLDGDRKKEELSIERFLLPLGIFQYSSYRETYTVIYKPEEEILPSRKFFWRKKSARAAALLFLAIITVAAGLMLVRCTNPYIFILLLCAAVIIPFAEWKLLGRNKPKKVKKVKAFRSLTLRKFPSIRLSPAVICLLACMALFITAITVISTAAKTVHTVHMESLKYGHHQGAKSIGSAAASGMVVSLSGKDAATELREYYQLIDGDRFSQAYEKQSARMRNRISYREYLTMWMPNKSVKVESLSVLGQTGREAQIHVQLTADDPDERGRIVAAKWLGIVRLVFENNTWHYDGGDFHKAKS